MRDTVELRPDHMSDDELVHELRRVRLHFKGNGSEVIAGGFKRSTAMRQKEVEREIIARATRDPQRG